METKDEPHRRVTFREVLGVSEFRAMWLAELLSIAGDQIARVALSVMVFNSTQSAALTGLTYGLTYVPSLLGGILLTGLADRLPRREVMVVSDLLRAVLILAVAIPGLPFWSLCVLVGAVSLLKPVFKAAQMALLPDVLPGERYVAGMAIRNMTGQGAQLLGFAGGGVLIAALSPRTGLVLDAVTFVASALLAQFGIRARPAAAAASVAGIGQERSWKQSIRAGAGLAFADRGMRALILLTWLMAAMTVYEGLAAPYVAAIGGGTASVGILLAADPLGGVIGAYVSGRWVPAHVRVRLMGPLAMLAGVVLGLCTLRPGVAGSLVLFFISGAIGTMVVMQATISFTIAVPDASRGQVLGLCSTGLTTATGISPLMGGLLADHLGAPETVGWFGLGCAVLIVPLAIVWRRAVREEPDRWSPRDEPKRPGRR